MKATAIKVRYASLKSVKRFFGTKESAINFPADFDKSNADEVLFLKAIKAALNTTPNKNGERLVKPIFSFGRLLLKISKNADNFALSQCTIYITEYDYNDEKRVQVVIAPPMGNDEFDDEDIDDLSWLGQKPAVSEEDDDDTDEDEDEDDEDAEEAPKAKSRKK